MADRERTGVRRWLAWLQNSPWLMIALGLHVILAAWISLTYVQREQAAVRESATQVAVATRAPDAPPPLPPPDEPDRDAIPEHEKEVQIVEPDDSELVFVPMDEPVEADPFADPGDPTGTGEDEPAASSTTISIGPGKGIRGAKPSSFGWRPGGKGQGGARPGQPLLAPPKATEKAVLEGLKWLLRHQEADGSWTAEYAAHCTPAGACRPADAAAAVPYYDEGLTGLALLAFLGRGIGMGSKVVVRDEAMGVQHDAGQAVKEAVKWLCARQERDGSFAAPRTFLYNEAIATLALCEAYGVTRPRNHSLKRAAQAGVDFLVAAQKVDATGAPSGWRYGSRAELDAELARGAIDIEAHAAEAQDSDLSVTGWVVMALKSAEIVGLEVPPHALAGALAFTEQVTGQEGLVGYRERGRAGQALVGPGDRYAYHPGTMSALGMLVRTFARHDVSDPFLESGASVLVRDLPRASKDGLSVDYYYWYYASLALNQFDGPDSPRPGRGAYWKPWNDALVEAVVGLQDASRQREVCTRGGWLAEDRWGSQSGHALYATAMNVLTLEVYYRYENAFGVLPATTPAALPSASPK